MDNANKINFVPFNMTFGVIGDEWKKIADYMYHENVPLPSDHSMKISQGGDPTGTLAIRTLWKDGNAEFSCWLYIAKG